jgi:BirA family biotin operon repressor/biotin-[acetyl-CoA-carboxylase] ligase
VADYQTDGRGQGDHGWESAPGENILMSWLIRPAFLSVKDQFMLSKVVSLAIIDHLDKYLGNTYIKWPNDILAGTKKIAGILIEHSIMQDRISHSIAGIGLNLNQVQFPSFQVPATSLHIETGREFDMEKHCRKLIKALYFRFEQLRAGNREVLNRDYLEHLFRYRQRSLFRKEGQYFEGSIVGINDFGQLRVNVSGENRTFNFQEIQQVFN